ncbi:uncharacterized protein EV422DRAFT_502593 [Fimicolochytrium jonesii]|uniref:uncharacterized protein n=1 Tax=Fimicolochytrium jonesii TaxID=1396493 RepID=UPI0022FF37BD|nr:uncharacterized protein EV422DRAFT_502593 [Fimicolochytrium jonesii]KAI8826853.1 hypothetical protein EV422DRAFT_502593 [Fimicolochytrium jonesii]
MTSTLATPPPHLKRASTTDFHPTRHTRTSSDTIPRRTKSGASKLKWPSLKPAKAEYDPDGTVVDLSDVGLDGGHVGRTRSRVLVDGHRHARAVSASAMSLTRSVSVESNASLPGPRRWRRGLKGLLSGRRGGNGKGDGMINAGEYDGSALSIQTNDDDDIPTDLYTSSWRGFPFAPGNAAGREIEKDPVKAAADFDELVAGWGRCTADGGRTEDGGSNGRQNGAPSATPKKPGTHRLVDRLKAYENPDAHQVASEQYASNATLNASDENEDEYSATQSSSLSEDEVRDGEEYGLFTRSRKSRSIRSAASSRQGSLARRPRGSASGRAETESSGSLGAVVDDDAVWQRGLVTVSAPSTLSRPSTPIQHDSPSTTPDEGGQQQQKQQPVPLPRPTRRIRFESICAQVLGPNWLDQITPPPKPTPSTTIPTTTASTPHPLLRTRTPTTPKGTDSSLLDLFEFDLLLHERQRMELRQRRGRRRGSGGGGGGYPATGNKAEGGEEGWGGWVGKLLLSRDRTPAHATARPSPSPPTPQRGGKRSRRPGRRGGCGVRRGGSGPETGHGDGDGDGDELVHSIDWSTRAIVATRRADMDAPHAAKLGDSQLADLQRALEDELVGGEIDLAVKHHPVDDGLHADRQAASSEMTPPLHLGSANLSVALALPPPPLHSPPPISRRSRSSLHHPHTTNTKQTRGVRKKSTQVPWSSMFSYVREWSGLGGYTGLVRFLFGGGEGKGVNEGEEREMREMQQMRDFR